MQLLQLTAGFGGKADARCRYTPSGFEQLGSLLVRISGQSCCGWGMGPSIVRRCGTRELCGALWLRMLPWRYRGRRSLLYGRGQGAGANHLCYRYALSSILHVQRRLQSYVYSCLRASPRSCCEHQLLTPVAPTVLHSGTFAVL